MVFISYKSEEYDIAARIRSLLEANNYPCWMAPESIPAGSNYMHEIPKAIRTCDLFVLIISEASQQSQWVQKEIDRAVKFNKYIVPFHVDDSELSDAIDFVIANNQRIEASEDLEFACNELLLAVRTRHPAVKAPDPKPVLAQTPSVPKETGGKPAPAGTPELSQEMLLQLLGTLSPEYIEKIIPGYKAPTDAQAAPSPAAVPVAQASKPQIIAPNQLPGQPEKVILANPVKQPEVVSTAKQPEMVPAKPEPKQDTEQTDPEDPQAEQEELVPGVMSPLVPGPQKQQPADGHGQPLSPVQRRAHQAIMMEFRASYERNYVQTNPNGFKMKIDVLTDHRPHRKEEGVVVVPYGVKEIGEGVFAKRKALRCVVIPPTVEIIGANAFLDCVKLEKVIFHEGLQAICNNAFQGCHLLKKIALPQSLRRIGDFAFYGCSNADIPLHHQIEYIGAAAFNGCASVTIHHQNPAYYMHSGCVIDKAEHRIVTATADSKFPAIHNLRVIGNYAFEGCLSLSQVTVPDHVLRIGTRAFCGCVNLQEVTVEGNVEVVGRQAFAECSSLHKLLLKFGIEMIEQQAFLHCKNLRQVSVPNSVRYLAKDAFEGCPHAKH